MLKINGISSQQMRRVDEVAVEMGLEVLQMMEMAAFQMARLIRQEIGSLKGKRALIVCGKGNNGGDAIACARYLFNWGCECLLVAQEDLNDNAKHHWKLIKTMGIETSNDFPDDGEFDFVVDGILGYSIKGNVRKPYSDWIDSINRMKVPVFCYDIPSGLDPDDGSVHGVAIEATHTLTLAYPKKGLFADSAKEYVGKLFLGDIGIPDMVYEKVNEEFPDVSYNNPFIESSLFQIDL